jgi:hypothetical protein
LLIKSKERISSVTQVAPLLSVVEYKIVSMDKISKVKQSLQGMLRRMTQEKEETTNQENGISTNSKRRTQKQVLVKSKSLVENVDPPNVKPKRRVVSVCDRHLKRNTQVDKPCGFTNATATRNEERYQKRNLIQFSSSEEGASSQESTPPPEDNDTQKLQRSPFSPRKNWSKAQEKRVHFLPKPELCNIKISAPNSLQPPPTEGHCVAQYRLVRSLGD